nr:reverse transcriptase N-terminal domain-containing protein [uncultured Eisenbergiella sp.]
MNAQGSMTLFAGTMQTYKKLKWKEINWKQAELYVNRIQVRIVKAVQTDKWRFVKSLQKLITNSFYAKALAVRRVITNKGKNTCGIDGVI